MDPICLILDLPNKKLINKFHKRLFGLLTDATRKNILFSWINDKPPTKKNWQKIIMQCMPMEFPTCMLHSTTDVFYNIWDPYLRYIGPNLANTLTLGFLKRVILPILIHNSYRLFVFFILSYLNDLSVANTRLFVVVNVVIFYFYVFSLLCPNFQ